MLTRLLAAFLLFALGFGCIERKPMQVTKKESPVTARLTEMLESENRLLSGTDERPDGFANLNRRHRAEVYQFLAQSVISIPEDLYAASVILGRADSTAPEAVLQAHYLAVTAVGKGLGSAKVQAATMIDRYQALSGRPQLYGTQYFVDSVGVARLYPVDSTVSDSQRAEWNIQPLDSLRANLSGR
ncbi:hypothetical protein KQH51_04370 [bacterium]|nr:hypothetical protein [bacterium]MCB2202154.1 hypothetical protein [bacterium]